ncbi:4-hydroxyphenylacetaldehyde oxime monooxygenase-like [Panicum miliaceum]|uniref:4-hydroxyphenylacetaldehyde oxime monooxygenase-like n=1 Tax=Panicum miliaceum TaxID=4540 RepID=A0A3L6TJB5_PANMI|nr:4-hydroxyphenylacetaldehyde oxime monooxygenase-like [Panicum miliaceum]
MAMSLVDCLLPPQQWQWQLTFSVTVILVLALALATKRRGFSSTGRRLQLPPGPPRLPVLGNLHQIMGALPHRSLRALARRHGPVMQLRLGSVPTVVVSSAEAAREVMKTHDADCCSRPDTPGARRMSYDHKDVAFAPYDECWREMRRLFVVELLSMRRVHATWYAREAEVDKLIGRLSSAGGKPVYLQDYIFRLMDGIIGTVALGSIYGSQQFAHKKHFHVLFDEAMGVKSSFSAEDYFPNVAGRLVDRLTGLVSRREKVFWELDAFFDKIIDEHCLRSSRGTPDNGPGFIDVLVGLTKEQKQGSFSWFTRDHIKGMLSETFIGGVDTNSVAVVWAMAELIRNPRVLKKVQGEIRAVVGNKEKVQPDDLPKLKYLKLVLKETLRLHPVAPLLPPRESVRHVKICGYDVPAKTRIFVNVWAIGRDPAIWSDPEEFYPERFDGSDIDFNGAHFQLLPFGAGRRMCPGMAMGAATVEFTLANLLHCFDWELPEGMMAEVVSMEEAGGLTVNKKVPLVLVPTRF